MDVRIIKKSSQSAVASASYRSGESLYSERDDETKSYKKREVQPDSFILAPSHAPEWVNNREKLWNEVEKIERNWNAQLSREVLVALPVELTNEQQKALVSEYVKENFVEEGMVADVSIHRDKVENPHAHIMLTVRPFNPDGSWGNKKKKEYIKDNGEFVLDENGQKKYKTISLTNWDQKESLLLWRKNFAEKVNEWYLKLGINEKVSHESYEKQGLDKLPKQRLTLEEYNFENRLKEQAENDGQEYKPKTYYGKVNQEIEKANKEIEKINQKVVSLSDYREKYSNERVNQLNEVRKNASLTQEDWKAIRTVSGRLNGFVDYQNAQDNIIKLDNWNKNLEKQFFGLKAEEGVLTKAAHLHKTEPKKVLLYGFSPSKFQEEFKQKASEFKAKKEAFSKTKLAFNDLYSASKRVLEIQKEFTNEEFKFLYPQYDEMITGDTVEQMKLKEKYVKLFREEGMIRKSIPEIDNKSLKSSSSVDTEQLLNDWKDIKKSLMILERTKEKNKSEYRNAYEQYNADNVFATSIKYNESKEQITFKEIELASLEQKMTLNLLEKYPKISPNTINEIPSDIKGKLLELHVNGENTGSLSTDLKLIKEREEIKQKTNKDSRSFNNQEFNQESSGSKDVGGLLGALINDAQRQEPSKDDLEAKRQKNKKRLYKELGELEL